MSLRKLKTPVPQALVQVSDEEGFPVRGLSPTHVIGLYYRHTGQLSALFERLAEAHQSGGNVDTGDIQTMVVELLREAPLIMAEVIALASGSDAADEIEATDDAGEPLGMTNWEADVEIAKTLSFPVQADALTKIGNLTFTSDMPPGKFFALIAGAVNKAVALRPKSET